MSAYVLLNLLNGLIKCEACRAFYRFFAISFSINLINQEQKC